mgnify:CR=1 FL=1|tara:strand:+ start:7590 stop:8105 length:516 start_codon:yes stop_codon:yes gene_type:complete
MATATTADMPDTKTAPVLVRERRSPRVMQKDFCLEYGGFAHNVWSATLAEEFTLEDALKEDFWAHVSLGRERSIRPDDIIQVRSRDHTLFAELYVRDSGPAYARVELLRVKEWGQRVPVDADAPLTIRWNLGLRKHEVQRKSDGVVMFTAALKEDAAAWLADHVRAMSVAA